MGEVTQKQLIEYRNGLCLTLIRSTDHSLRFLKISKIRKAAERARERMIGEGYSAVDVEALVAKLYELDSHVSARGMMKGIGFYVSKDIAATVLFPFEVKEKIRTGTAFDPAELIALQRYNASYYVVELSSENVRLFKGGDLKLEEVVDHHFPMEAKKVSAGGTKAKSAGGVIGLYEEAGKALLDYINPDAPMIVCGSKDEIAAFRRVTNCEYFIAAAKRGHLKGQPSAGLCRKFREEAFKFRNKPATVLK